MDLSLGTIVTVPQGRGVVRFVGTTSFKEGKWLGIELDECLLLGGAAMLSSGREGEKEWREGLLFKRWLSGRGVALLF